MKSLRLPLTMALTVRSRLGRRRPGRCAGVAVPQSRWWCWGSGYAATAGLGDPDWRGDPAGRLASVDRALGPRQSTDPDGPWLQSDPDPCADHGRSHIRFGALLANARDRDPGARLQLRFVTPVARLAAALAPAVVVALFYGVLVTRGVDNWFSQRVQTVVENSAKVARSYVDEQSHYIQDHVAVMAGDLNNAAPALQASPITFNQFLASLASVPRLRGRLSGRPRRAGCWRAPRRPRALPLFLDRAAAALKREGGRRGRNHLGVQRQVRRRHARALQVA